MDCETKTVTNRTVTVRELLKGSSGSKLHEGLSAKVTVVVDKECKRHATIEVAIDEHADHGRALPSPHWSLVNVDTLVPTGKETRVIERSSTDHDLVKFEIDDTNIQADPP